MCKYEIGFGEERNAMNENSGARHRGRWLPCMPMRQGCAASCASVSGVARPPGALAERDLRAGFARAFRLFCVTVEKCVLSAGSVSYEVYGKRKAF
jgi:hypothetical protein